MSKLCGGCYYFDREISHCERFECETREHSIACNAFKPIENKGRKMSKTCGECRYFLVQNHWACQEKRSRKISWNSEICNKFALPTVGDNIRQASDDELAERLVYPVKPMNINGHVCYEFTSCLLLGRSYSIREQAVFLTERRISAPAESEEKDE